MDLGLITTTNHLQGYRITRQLGVVRGISVRSRGMWGNIAGSFQTLLSGKISLYEALCERTRHESFKLMISHAEQRGANAIIGMRYDATEVLKGVTEVLAYGTAVLVEKDS